MPTTPYGMGWLRDYPNLRDFTIHTDEDQMNLSPRLKSLKQRPVKSDLGTLGVLKPGGAALPQTTDLRQWCSEIFDQKRLGSCTANAGVGLVEYFENRAFGRHIDASRLFLYKATRDLLHWKGDTGAYLRTTMEAMTLFGTPPEEYCPYTDAAPAFDVEPGAFQYAFAQNYQTIKYYRLDPPGTTPENLLNEIKKWLVAGLPSMFGFSVYSSFRQADETGKIPFPARGEQIVGGHAVDVVGYDDAMRVKNASPQAQETIGALLIRNSWGMGWGEKGYGWLPYEYVLQGLAVDWWSLIKSEWVDTKQFGL